MVQLLVQVLGGAIAGVYALEAQRVPIAAPAGQLVRQQRPILAELHASQGHLHMPSTPASLPGCMQSEGRRAGA